MKKLIKKVAFVELQPAKPHIGSYLICPTYGPVLLATKLKKLGYEAVVYVEGITQISIEELQQYDIVCFSIQTPAANKSYLLSDQIREISKKIVIFGGAHSTFFSEDGLAHCDYVVRGEGDNILPDLIRCIEKGGALKAVKGVSYFDNGQIIHNEPAPHPTDLSCSADYTVIKNLDYWTPLRRFFRHKLFMLPVQSSRGCPNSCTFCVVKDLFGSLYRKRPVASVIEEIKSAAKFTKHIYFVDNNFVGSAKKNIQETCNLLHAIRANKLKIKASVFVTIDVAKNERLLQIMRGSGIKVLMVGFESIDRDSLEMYHKNQTPTVMERNVKILKKYKFTILGSFMAGSNGEDEFVVAQTASLSAKWKIDQFYYFILSPYPSMQELIPSKRVFLSNWDFGTGIHIYFFPKNISPSNLQKAIIKANHVFYSYWRMLKCVFVFEIKSAINLFLLRILFYKIMRPIRTEYIPFLQTIETNLYNEGVLSEEILDLNNVEKIKYWKKNY